MFGRHVKETISLANRFLKFVCYTLVVLLIATILNFLVYVW